MITEFIIQINKRDTVIRYKEDLDVKQLIIHIEKYRKMNKWKFQIFRVKTETFNIIDKEYKEFLDSNAETFRFDNEELFLTFKSFKPKSKIKKLLEKILNVKN